MKTDYYYVSNPGGDFNTTVDEPGELCDYCSKLSTMCKRGSLIPMPETPVDSEFGKEGGGGIYTPPFSVLERL
jgi:hypothetical protein